MTLAVGYIRRVADDIKLSLKPADPNVLKTMWRRLVSGVEIRSFDNIEWKNILVPLSGVLRAIDIITDNARRLLYEEDFFLANVNGVYGSGKTQFIYILSTELENNFYGSVINIVYSLGDSPKFKRFILEVIKQMREHQKALSPDKRETLNEILKKMDDLEYPGELVKALKELGKRELLTVIHLDELDEVRSDDPNWIDWKIFLTKIVNEMPRTMVILYCTKSSINRLFLSGEDADKLERITGQISMNSYSMPVNYLNELENAIARILALFEFVEIAGNKLDRESLDSFISIIKELENKLRHNYTIRKSNMIIIKLLKIIKHAGKAIIEIDKIYEPIKLGNEVESSIKKILAQFKWEFSKQNKKYYIKFNPNNKKVSSGHQTDGQFEVYDITYGSIDTGVLIGEIPVEIKWVGARKTVDMKKIVTVGKLANNIITIIINDPSASREVKRIMTTLELKLKQENVPNRIIKIPGGIGKLSILYAKNKIPEDAKNLFYELLTRILELGPHIQQFINNAIEKERLTVLESPIEPPGKPKEKKEEAEEKIDLGNIEILAEAVANQLVELIDSIKTSWQINTLHRKAKKLMRLIDKGTLNKILELLDEKDYVELFTEKGEKRIRKDRAWSKEVAMKLVKEYIINQQQKPVFVDF